MKTEIAFILDRSGSMESIRQPTIEGFNTFLRDQQSAPGETRFSLTLFDTTFECRHTSLPIAEVPPLHADTYIPDGGTALLDAIGETIDSLGQKLAALPDTERPGHVTFAILTDGEENSSRRYSWLQIADRIKHQTETYSWEFLFLGAGPDTIASAGRMGIHYSKISSFTADEAGQHAAMAGVSRKVLASRAKKSGLATPEQLHDADAPMSEILHEEDQKRRP